MHHYYYLIYAKYIIHLKRSLAFFFNIKKGKDARSNNNKIYIYNNINSLDL